jgi:hypothetical protein
MISDPQDFQVHHTFDKADWWLSFRGASWPVPHATELNQKVHNVKKRRVAAAVLKAVLPSRQWLTVSTVLNELHVKERAMHGRDDPPVDGAAFYKVCHNRRHL